MMTHGESATGHEEPAVRNATGNSPRSETSEPINNNLAQGGIKLTSEDRESAGPCFINDRIGQVDEENGLTDPSSYSSSSSSAHPPCGSTSSSSPSENANRQHIPSGPAFDVHAKVLITDCISSQRRDSCTSKKDLQIASCYNPALDDEIRNRLDKLNSLSDLINSLELQFDQANSLFRDTLKCSTERLSIIAKTLGSKSIRYGRSYHAAKISVEQSQSDCQKACVQFEKANHDHQHAKEAIRRAETKLKKTNSSSLQDITDEATTGAVSPAHRVHNGHIDLQASTSNSFEFSDLCRLKLDDIETEKSKNLEYSRNDCDRKVGPNELDSPRQRKAITLSNENLAIDQSATGTSKSQQSGLPVDSDTSHEVKIKYDAEISEELNQAIIKLIDAEQKRRESEKAHLDQANKLMFAQENLLKLEREHGNSIRRSQVYFDEARRFIAKLDSVKSDIARISEEIIAAKRSYAKTLNELEQFSEDLHINSSSNLANLNRGHNKD